MDHKPKTAIILGATGLTGSRLLRHILKDGTYGLVRLFSRNSVGIEHPKLEEHLLEMDALPTTKEYFQGDVLFCCIGTTRARTPNKTKYRAIDYGIPVQAAALSKEMGIPTFIVISSLGANPKSKMFYNRTKGQMETAVLRYDIPNTYILQPSILAGKREELRLGEWIARQVMKVMNLVMVGPLDKFRSIDPDTVSKCMLWLAEHHCDKQRIPSDLIRKIAHRYGR